MNKHSRTNTNDKSSQSKPLGCIKRYVLAKQTNAHTPAQSSFEKSPRRIAICLENGRPEEIAKECGGNRNTNCELSKGVQSTVYTPSARTHTHSPKQTNHTTHTCTQKRRSLCVYVNAVKWKCASGGKARPHKATHLRAKCVHLTFRLKASAAAALFVSVCMCACVCVWSYATADILTHAETTTHAQIPSWECHLLAQFRPLRIPSSPFCSVGLHSQFACWAGTYSDAPPCCCRRRCC